MARRIRQVARRARVSVRQVAVGLEKALWESGPNPLTDFADALEFEGKPMMAPDAKERWEGLGSLREALTAFLDGTDAVFVGGVAVRSHGGSFRLPLRPTGDYDLLIPESLLKGLTRFLESQGAVLDSSDEECYFFYLKSLDFHIDVMVARSSLYKAAIETATRASFQGRKLRLVTPVALAAMKVKAWSERRNRRKKAIDRSDILGLLEVGATTKEEVRALLSKHRADLVAEFEKLLDKPLP